MSMSTVGSPSAAAMRSIVLGGLLRGLTAGQQHLAHAACRRRAPAAPGRPTARRARRGAAGRAVGGPPCNRSCASRRTTPPEPAGQTAHDRQSRRRRRARAKNTGPALALAYIQWVSTAEKQVDTQSPDGGEVVGVPSIGETLGGLAARVRPGPHGDPRGGASWAASSRASRSAARRSRPRKGDRRFTDPAWSGNPLFSRIERGYLATAQARQQRGRASWAEGADDQRRAEQARFAATILTSALAPTNFLATNPAALKRAFDTGGTSLVRGLAQLRRRRAAQRRHAVDGRPRRVRGGHGPRASRPARSSYRDEVAELLQYTPTHRAGARAAGADHPAADRPLLLPRPAPGPQLRRVRRQPGHADLPAQLAQPAPPSRPTGTSTPTPRGCSRAIDAVREITGSDDVNVIGLLRRRHHHHHAAQPPRRDRRRPRAQHVLRGHPARLRPTARRSARSPAPRLLRVRQGTLAAHGRHHRRATWARRSPGCGPTTWSSTTGSTTT